MPNTFAPLCNLNATNNSNALSHLPFFAVLVLTFYVTANALKTLHLRSKANEKRTNSESIFRHFYMVLWVLCPFVFNELANGARFAHGICGSWKSRAVRESQRPTHPVLIGWQVKCASDEGNPFDRTWGLARQAANRPWKRLAHSASGAIHTTFTLMPLYSEWTEGITQGVNASQCTYNDWGGQSRR
jgi:hypothetical protein